MADLTDEEKRILELMNQLEAKEKPSPDEPAPSERFTTPLFFDDEGKPFPVEGRLPSAEEHAAKNREAIKALEERLRRGPPAPGAPDGEPKRDDKRRG